MKAVEYFRDLLKVQSGEYAIERYIDRWYYGECGRVRFWILHSVSHEEEVWVGGSDMPSYQDGTRIVSVEGYAYRIELELAQARRMVSVDGAIWATMDEALKEMVSCLRDLGEALQTLPRLEDGSGLEGNPWWDRLPGAV